MVLVDTSIWVDHLRRGCDRLSRLLHDNEVTCHPFIVGELACGSLRNRDEILSLLAALPGLGKVEDDELLLFINEHDLSGQGLGLVDAHLLASCRLAATPIWTRDRKLAEAATGLGLSAK